MIYGYELFINSSLTYVGITTDVSRRIREHRSKGPMSDAEFHVEKIYEFSTREEASLWEINRIKEIGIENLRNSSLGGFGGRKRFCSEKEKANLSEKAKVRYLGGDYRHRMGAAVSRAFSNPESRRRLSDAVKESCAKPETRAKRSTAQKSSWSDPEVRQKRLEGLRKNRTDPAKAEMRRAAAFKAWAKRRGEA